jgi:hypothetical protein
MMESHLVALKGTVVHISIMLALLAVLVGGCLPSPPDPQEIPEGPPIPPARFQMRIAGASRLTCGKLMSLRIFAFLEENLRALSGVNVTLDLITSQDGALRLYEGKTNTDGTLEMKFPCPSVKDEKGTLRIDARFGKAKRSFSFPVALRRLPWKIVLCAAARKIAVGDTLTLGGHLISEATLKPVAGHDVSITVTGPGDKAIPEQRCKTSPEGSFSVALASESLAAPGRYAVTARAGSVRASIGLAVESSPPMAALSIDPDHKVLSPGETARITLTCAADTGLPITGLAAKVRIASDQARQASVTLEGKTDAHGRCEIQYRIPGNILISRHGEAEAATLLLTAEVVQGGAVLASKTMGLVVARSSYVVALVPERTFLRRGLPNRILLMSWYHEGRPAPCDVILQLGREKRVLTTDSTGFAETFYTPGDESEVPCKIMARDKHGARTFRSVTFPVAPARDGLMIRSISVGKTGQQADLLIHSTRPAGTVFIDFVKDGEIVATESAELAANKATLSFKCIREIAGLCSIHAYQFLSDCTMISDTLHLYTYPPSQLRVDLTMRRQAHRPYDDAAAIYTIWTKGGKPVRSSIDLDILDEPPGEGAGPLPGRQLLSVLIPEETLLDIPGAAGLSARRIFLAIRRFPHNQWYQRLAQLALSQYAAEPSYGILVDTYAPRAREILKTMEEINPLLDEYRSRYGHYPSMLRDLVRRKMVSHEKSIDPWGRSFQLAPSKAAAFTPSPPFGLFTKKPPPARSERARGMPDLVCRGADGVLGTADDISFNDSFSRSSEKEGRPVEAGTLLPDTQPPEPYEALACFPAVRTDSGGRAIVQIHRSDTSRALRLNTTVWTSSGDMGEDSRALEVPGNCLMEAALPQRIARGDNFTFPAVLTNLMPERQGVTVRLTVPTSPCVSLLGTEQHIELSPRGQGALTFQLEAHKAGSCALDAIVEGKGKNWTRGYKVSVLSPEPGAAASGTLRLTASPADLRIGDKVLITIMTDSPGGEIRFTIPPGFTVDAGEIEELRDRGVIRAFKAEKQSIVLFLPTSPGGRSVSFHLDARYPASVTVLPAELLCSDGALRCLSNTIRLTIKE